MYSVCTCIVKGYPAIQGRGALIDRTTVKTWRSVWRTVVIMQFAVETHRDGGLQELRLGAFCSLLSHTTALINTALSSSPALLQN